MSLYHKNVIFGFGEENKMDLVQIKIKKDDNTISYIKLIREFDKTIPISEIKRRIENNDFVYGFDLDRRDWM